MTGTGASATAAAQEETVDLVVAGAGGGLAGALRAAEAGLSVLVVDPDEQFLRGNNTSMSTAMIPGPGSRWQRAAGIDDDPERFLSDVRAKTRGGADARLAAALARAGAPLVEWLADRVGLPIELVRDFSYPGHSADRLHTVPGRHGSVLLRGLYERARRSPSIDFLVPARLVDVAFSRGPGSPLSGAVLEYPHGRRETVGARAVLLATNGYGADRELVARHLPEIARAAYHGGQFSRGDGLAIGLRHGAAAAFMDAYQGHAALARRSATLVGWATVMHGAIMVDASGARFGDETRGYSEYAAALAARPEARGWIVFDRRIHDLCGCFADFRQTVEAGAVIWAGGADALAERIGCAPDHLRASLDEQSACARGAAQDTFGRSFFEAALEPPFAAVEVVPALFHTQGGLIVDGHARVLDAAGVPLPGLYASGGAAHGLSGHGADGYLAGNGLLPALGLAWLAAGHLAAATAPPGRPRPQSAPTPPPTKGDAR